MELKIKTYHSCTIKLEYEEWNTLRLLLILYLSKMDRGSGSYRILSLLSSTEQFPPDHLSLSIDKEFANIIIQAIDNAGYTNSFTDKLLDIANEASSYC